MVLTLPLFFRRQYSSISIFSKPLISRCLPIRNSNIMAFHNSATRAYTQKTVPSKIHAYINRSRILTKLFSYPPAARFLEALLQNGPFSNITAFLILHEVTAIAPLFSIWWVLYGFTDFDASMLPSYITEKINQGLPFIEKVCGEKSAELDKEKLVLTGTLAYFIVKALYPFRVLASLWGAPYVARWMISPFQKLQRKFIKRGTGER
ncbi:HHL196Wp [Eremothecium sinecaudum]|uniref:HHL196Wp n=1 Tax=Eremothecium sinecaudum TaxID=45286 RepID=A0A0X8HW22_9SACH|nr:HHL196Wp [Eremothecium sinecaudum]AMD22574.1 HHL196Wp [Eremothecium sinecaudum]